MVLVPRPIQEASFQARPPFISPLDSNQTNKQTNRQTEQGDLIGPRLKDKRREGEMIRGAWAKGREKKTNKKGSGNKVKTK